MNSKWVKASVLGSIWGSSEIVIGSFLHNLKVPFSGNILTALAIILFIAVAQKWRENGLFWRAGVICAFLKTLSPSAVIFGPMLAIIAQSIIIELSTRFVGRNLIGFALGGTLAMAWNLVQKIINYIIVYGPNVVKIYYDLVKYAQKQFKIEFDIFWMPLASLLGFYMAFGFFSAILGIVLVKKARNAKPYSNSFSSSINLHQKAGSDFKHSYTWLFTNLVLFISCLLVISLVSWFIWAPTVIAVVFIWGIKYKRALRQLAKPRFWIAFMVITMLTTFVFSKFQGLSIPEAVLIGFQMNFRAAIVILGFTVLGTEMYNPKIRKWLLSSIFKEYSGALNLSLESLPSLIASTPSVKDFFRNPTMVINHVVNLAEERLNQLNSKLKIYIITGSIGEGKTTFVSLLANQLMKQGITTFGVLSFRSEAGSGSKGYNVYHIKAEKTKPLLIESKIPAQDRIGRYVIIKEGFRFGEDALKPSNINGFSVAIIDEVGLLEVEGKGWAKSLGQLLNQKGVILIISVRTNFVEAVISKWGFCNYKIVRVTESNPSLIFDEILLQQKEEFPTR